MAPGRRPIAGYKHPMVYPTDHGQTTDVTKSLSGEIALQQSKCILQEISYRSGSRSDIAARLTDSSTLLREHKP
jgi:hypothetical protein